jgi:hypothetical protein
MGLYIHSPVRLHGVVLKDNFTFYLYRMKHPNAMCGQNAELSMLKQVAYL